MQVSAGQGARVAPVPRTGGEGLLAGRVAGVRVAPAVAVAALTVLGLALRVAVADETVFGDELSSWWIVSTNGLGGVLSTVHSDAEISPPLFFVASWLATQIDLTPELFRAPSLVAGVVSIPLVYLVGLRTVGRAAALVGTAAITLSPFLIYYSAEARGYALMMAFVVASTLALLVAAESGRTFWWVVYAVCSCAAMYSHYTAAFALGGQVLWLFWAHPGARRACLLANAAAALAFLPWISGLLADFDSPTTEILSAINPFGWEYAWTSLSHAAVGYPYGSTDLGELPGVPALVMFAVALVLATGAVVLRAVGSRRDGRLRRPAPGLVLVVVLALSVPVGEALVSAAGTNLFGGRNLVAGLPAAALCLGALLVGAGPRLRFVCVPLALGCLAVGAVMMLEGQRPNYRAAAADVERRSAPGDVVIDAAVLSPGPYSPLDLALERPHRVLRSGAPQQNERPFGVFDRRVTRAQAAKAAIAAADRGRIFVVSAPQANQPGLRGRPPTAASFRPAYRLVETRTYPGSSELKLQVWAPR